MKKLVIVLALLLLVIPISFTKKVEILDVRDEDVGEGVEVGATYYAVMNGQIVAGVRDNEVNYYHKNWLNSNIVGEGRSKTLPFGQELLNPNHKFTFTGKEEDSSGLYYFGARYYDSDLGRFVSTDPVVDNHAYVYTMNNPLRFVDPTGMTSFEEKRKAYLNYLKELPGETLLGAVGIGEASPYRKYTIEAEAATAVVINRLHHPDYPSTVYDIVASGQYGSVTGRRSSERMGLGSPVVLAFIGYFKPDEPTGYSGGAQTMAAESEYLEARNLREIFEGAAREALAGRSRAVQYFEGALFQGGYKLDLLAERTGFWKRIKDERTYVLVGEDTAIAWGSKEKMPAWAHTYWEIVDQMGGDPYHLTTYEDIDVLRGLAEGRTSSAVAAIEARERME